MRTMAMVTLIAFVVIPTLVSAETWSARVTLNREKSTSGQHCPEGNITYTFTLADNSFTMASKYGQAFSIMVPADGVIKKTYKGTSPQGAQRTFEITGNVKSRDIEIFQTDFGCYYKVSPAS